MSQLDYALVGNCQISAMLDKSGTYVWSCMPRFDSPSIFAQLLDTEKAGFWSILPDAEYRTDESPHQRMDGGPVDPRWLIHRGLRVHYDAARLGKDLAPLENYAIKLQPGHEDVLSTFAFGDEERFVMAYLAKGFWALPDLVEACLGLPVTIVHALVYTLLACELLDVKPGFDPPTT
jgi:hypothetical protein